MQWFVIVLKKIHTAASETKVQADFVVIARKGVEELDYHQVEQNLLHVLKIAKLYQEGFICETEK